MINHIQNYSVIANVMTDMLHYGFCIKKNLQETFKKIFQSDFKTKWLENEKGRIKMAFPKAFS